MLKTKPLNALLSQSLSEHVSSAILFTPSGNLLASAAAPNSPDAKKARLHAALAANIWTKYESVTVKGFIEAALPPGPNNGESSSSKAPEPDITPLPSSTSNPKSGSSSKDSIKTLAVELSDNNLHIQAVTPRILLGLIGRRPGAGQPSSGSSQHSGEPSDPDPGVGTSKGATGPSVKPFVPGPTGPTGPTSAAGSVGSGGGGAMGMLKVTSQTLVDYLQKELKDFEPPDDL
ncbi:hypothetical protein ABW19_dt0206768 [Dactylella cylindrospora]|nr:hypothetical protein ABW19_dt0206768 [Dactylella cylindrospora]